MCVWGIVIGLDVCLGDVCLGEQSGSPMRVPSLLVLMAAQPKHLSDPLDALPSRCSEGRQSLCVYFVG